MQRQRQGFNKRERRAFARILLAVIIFALVALAVAPGRSLRSYMQAKQKTEAFAAENERLLQETTQLRLEIQRLRHDVKYLEKIAREKYGMLKKNEEVYYVNSGSSESAAPPPREPGTEESAL